jgi:hypothetical protein
MAKILLGTWQIIVYALICLVVSRHSNHQGH